MTSSASKLVPALTIAFDVNDEERKVLGVAFLSGDQHIITCSRDDGCLQVREAKTGKFVGDPWQDKERSQICAIDVSPNGNHVATGRKNGKVQVWKWNGPGRTATIVGKSEEHIAAALCVRWSRHDDGAHIACGFDNGNVAVFSFTASGLKEHMSTDDTCLQHVFAIDYSHDGTQLIVSGYDCKILTLQINERAREIRVHKVVRISSNPHHVPCVAWASTADRHAFVTGSTDCKIKMVELPEGSECVLDGHSDHVCAIGLSPDKRVLASVSYDGTLRFWDLNTKQPIGQPLPHSAKLSCVAFAAAGTSVVTGTFDGKIYVWDLFSRNVNGHDKDTNDRPPFNPDSQIPTIQRRRAWRSPAPTGSTPPIKFDSKKFFGTDAGNEAGDTSTGGVSRTGRFSWHEIKVAASRAQQALRVPRIQLERPNVEEASSQNLHRMQIGTSVDAAFGRTAEPINHIIVPHTLWVKFWLRVGCIPQYTSEQLEMN